MMRNPVFESSMKRRMRSFRSPMLITLYCIFLVLVSTAALRTLMSGEVSLGNLRAGLETYVYLSVMQFMLIILVAPALTTGAISGERERQTLDLLLCTRVGSMRIVLGKLMSSVCFLGLMTVASLPVIAITLFFGGVSIWDMLAMELFLLVTAIACCAIGIFCSAVFKRTVTATVVAYLAIFALGVGTIVFPLLFQANQISELLYGSGPSMYSSSYYGGSVAIIGGISSGSATDYTSQILSFVPKLLFINPAVGLFSLLVEQTGLLQRTFNEYMGYRGSQFYQLIEMIGSVAWINMIALTLCSVVLVAISALFVKPAGRKVKKRKPQ